MFLKVQNGFFLHFLRCNPALQPGWLQHPPGHALPFGQTFGSPFGFTSIFAVKSPSDLSCFRLADCAMIQELWPAKAKVIARLPKTGAGKLFAVVILSNA